MTKLITPRVYYDTIDWTIEQYHDMVEAGVLTANDKVELLYNKIVPMSPVGRFHAACVSNIQEYFILKFKKKFTYRTQDPVAMLDHSEPEPDFVIAERSDSNYVDAHPESHNIIILIEVSDTTLDKDRNFKMGIYASASVREYWIINLVERQIEIYTDPESESRIYRAEAFHVEGEVLQHETLGKIAVSELLPGGRLT